MEPIKSDFVRHPKKNEDAAHEAHGKARHIDKRVNLFAKDIARGDEKEVAEHDRMELDGKILFLQASIAKLNYQCIKVTPLIWRFPPNCLSAYVDSSGYQSGGLQSHRMNERDTKDWLEVQTAF